MIPIILIYNSEIKKSKFINKQCDKLKIKKKTNLIILNEDDQILSIDHVRNIYQSKLLNSTSNSQHKIIVINNLDLARLETQNSLLKIIEESNEKILFVLCAKSKERIIKTILSRSKIVNIIEKKKKTSNFYIDIIDSNLPFLMKNNCFVNKEEALIFCDNLINHLRLKSNLSNKINLLIKEILITRNLIEQNNINFQFAIDHLLIFIRNYVKDKI